MTSNETKIINTLLKLLKKKNLAHIREMIQRVKEEVERLSHVKNNKHPRRKQRGVLSLPRTRESSVLDSRFRGNDDASVGELNPKENKESGNIEMNYVLGELDQILDTRTIERTKYYIKRLARALSETKTGQINDLNLHRWKEYDDILTDSLWVLGKRDTSGAHNGGYWGNFIPQIPNQLLRRFTKKGEWVLDAFLGSGTTLIESRRLGRNGVGVELQRKVANSATKAIDQESILYSTRTEIIVGDSSNLDFRSELHKRKIKSVQFLIMHPPYWDIVKFSKDKRDLSNAKSIDDFLSLFGKISGCYVSDFRQGQVFRSRYWR